jgi:aspartyl-tRNA synthetase
MSLEGHAVRMEGIDKPTARFKSEIVNVSDHFGAEDRGMKEM